MAVELETSHEKITPNLVNTKIETSLLAPNPLGDDKTSVTQ